MVNDAARAFYLPGIGNFGSGFTADPAVLWERMRDKSVKLIQSEELRF